MKKFFSLVLALVMALSLTTMAWGADAADLAALKAVVTTGGEVKLTASIDINATTGTQDRLVVAKDLVVDLNGFELSSTDAADDIFYVQDGASLTVKNGTLDSARLGIYSNGNGTDANVIVLDNVKLNSNYFGIYHNGNNYGAVVTIQNGSVVKDASVDGAGVFLSGSKAWASNQLSKLTIINSTVEGASAVEVKYADVVVTNSTLKATGTATMQFNDNGSNTAGYALALTHSGGTGGAEDATGSITVNSGSFTGAVGIQESGNTAAGTTAAETANTTDATIAVKGGTFTDDVTDYVEPGSTVVIAGDTVVKNTDGSVAVNPVAQVGNTKYETVADAVAAAPAGGTVKLLANNTENVAINKSITLDSNGYTFAATAAAGYTMTQNSASTFAVVPVGTSVAGDYKIFANTVAGTLYSTIDVNQGAVFTKVPATAPKMGDNLTWVGGNIEYYVAKDLARNNLYFYEVADKDDATHVIKNGKTVYKYVIMLSDPSEAAYTYTATVSKNTAMNSSDCGKVNVVGWDKKSVLYTYVDSNGLVQFATDDASASANGTIRLNAAGVVDDYYKVNVNQHTFYPTYTKGDVSGATCGKCGLVASRVKSAASLPAKFVEITAVRCTGAFAGNILYYVPSTASLPSGGVVVGPVVESAETFDAGIAMYVGMSVMAAAGSAVVLKKKD